MRYWVLSPNIGMIGGALLERWNELILKHKAVFMGWPPDPKRDGRMRLGYKFAHDVRPPDVILSAHRQDGDWTLVACGRVRERRARHDLRLGIDYDYGTYRSLEPFVRLEPDPNLSGLSLKGTSPDRRRNIPTLVELRGDENTADRRLCKSLDAILQSPGMASEQAALDLPDEETLELLAKKSYRERRRHYVLHRRLEGVRNKKLVTDAKQFFKKSHRGRLTCEVCDTNLEKEYGPRGSDFIEAHHRVPIAKIKRTTKLRISDLAMVCANCHRMLHRDPWISVENLRREWKKLHRVQKNPQEGSVTYEAAKSLKEISPQQLEW